QAIGEDAEGEGEGLAGGHQVRVPGDFPHVAVGVLKVACVAAPERVGGRLDDMGASVAGLRDDVIHLGPRTDVVAQRDRTYAKRYADGGVVGQVFARIERQPQSRFEIEEDHGAVLELRTYDALGGPAEPVAIKLQRALQVSDTQREDRDARFHVR